MDKEHVAWASLHDWFIGSEWIIGDEYQVIVRDDMVTPSTLTFTDFDELYTWAGY